MEFGWRPIHEVSSAPNLARLEREFTEGANKELSEIVDPVILPHVHSDQGLDLALERMGVNQLEALPAIGRAKIRELKGIFTLHDILNAYGVARSD